LFGSAELAFTATQSAKTSCRANNSAIRLQEPSLAGQLGVFEGICDVVKNGKIIDGLSIDSTHKSSPQPVPDLIDL